MMDELVIIFPQTTIGGVYNAAAGRQADLANRTNAIEVDR
jgi:hypothetical protein